MSWQSIGESERIETGTVYRSRFTIGLRWQPQYAAIIAGVRTLARPALSAVGLELLSVSYVLPMDLSRPWELQAVWRKKGG